MVWSKRYQACFDRKSHPSAGRLAQNNELGWAHVEDSPVASCKVLKIYVGPESLRGVTRISSFLCF